MNQSVVRKCKPDELPEVRKLFEAVFENTFPGHIPVFEEATHGEEIYVALLNDNIVGFASIWEPDHFIHYLFVSPNARRKKIGSTIVSSLAEIYGVPLSLKCLVKNKVGMAFYRATGWQKAANGSCDDGDYELLRYN